MTSIVVTHDIEGALDISDRVALLDDGKLRFVGTPDEFRAQRGPARARLRRPKAAAEAAAVKIMEDNRDRRQAPAPGAR